MAEMGVVAASRVRVEPWGRAYAGFNRMGPTGSVFVTFEFFVVTSDSPIWTCEAGVRRTICQEPSLLVRGEWGNYKKREKREKRVSGMSVLFVRMIRGYTCCTVVLWRMPSREDVETSIRWGGELGKLRRTRNTQKQTLSESPVWGVKRWDAGRGHAGVDRVWPAGLFFRTFEFFVVAPDSSPPSREGGGSGFGVNRPAGSWRRGRAVGRGGRGRAVSSRAPVRGWCGSARRPAWPASSRCRSRSRAPGL